MKAVIKDELHGADTRLSLNLAREAQLLQNSSPNALIDHLDLLLTAGTLTDDSRQILTEWVGRHFHRICNTTLGALRHG